MTVRIQPAVLKAAAKVAAQVKDTTGAGKRYSWLTLHRLVAQDGGLTLYSNDGSVWLEWRLALDEPTSDTYEILLSSTVFNDTVSKSLDNKPYSIEYGNGEWSLTQGVRQLRLRVENPQVYPDPFDGEGEQQLTTVTVPTVPLMKALRFVAPFIDPTHAKIKMQVASWTPDGTISAGSGRAVVRVRGVPAAPGVVSGKQRVVRAIAAFLAALGDQVEVTRLEITKDKDVRVLNIFACPVNGHRLIVVGESVSFPTVMQDLEGCAADIFKFDGRSLRQGVAVLNPLLPAEADRLFLRIRGEREDSYLTLSTLADETKGSSDEFPIIRDHVIDPGSEIRVSIHHKVFEHMLNQMEGVILEGRYYPGKRRLYIEDEQAQQGDSVRAVQVSVLVTGDEALVPAGDGLGEAAAQPTVSSEVRG